MKWGLKPQTWTEKLAAYEQWRQGGDVTTLKLFISATHGNGCDLLPQIIKYMLSANFSSQSYNLIPRERLIYSTDCDEVAKIINIWLKLLNKINYFVVECLKARTHNFSSFVNEKVKLKLWSCPGNKFEPLKFKKNI